MRVIRTIHPVGQGAFYTEQIDDYNIVYDCGTLGPKGAKKQTEEIIKHEYSYIKNGTLLKKTILAVFISHFHDDHMNCLTKLLKTADVKYIFFPYVNEINKKILLISDISKATQEFILDPKRAVHKISKKTKVILVREYSNEEYYAEESSNFPNEIFLDNSYSLDYVNSGVKIKLSSSIANWVYIPFNLRQEHNYKRITHILKSRGVSALSHNQWDEIYIDELKKVCKKVFPTNEEMNLNSMVLYSGYYEPHFLIYYRLTADDIYSYRIEQKRWGCLYLGDYDLTKGGWETIENVYTPFLHDISDHDFLCHLLADSDSCFLNLDDQVAADGIDHGDAAARHKAEIFQMPFGLGIAADLADDVFLTDRCKCNGHHCILLGC